MPKVQNKHRRFFSTQSKQSTLSKSRRLRKYKGGVSFNAVFTPSEIPSGSMYPLNPYEVRPELGLSTRTIGGASLRRGRRTAKRRAVTKRNRRQRRLIGGTSDVLLGQTVNNPVIGLGTSAANQTTYNNFMSGPASVPGVPIPFIPGAPNPNLPALV